MSFKDDVDARLLKAGGKTVDELIYKNPLNSFLVHTGVTDMETYHKWLKMRLDEVFTLQLTMELDGRKDDEMYEWMLSQAAAFKESLLNFEKALHFSQKQENTPML